MRSCSRAAVGAIFALVGSACVVEEPPASCSDGSCAPKPQEPEPEPAFEEMCQAWHTEAADGTCENQPGFGRVQVRTRIVGQTCGHACGLGGHACVSGYSDYTRHVNVRHASCNYVPVASFEWGSGTANFVETICECEGGFERIDADLDTFSDCRTLCEGRGQRCRGRAVWGNRKGGAYFLYGDLDTQSVVIADCWDDVSAGTERLPLQRVTCACDAFD